MYEDESPVLFHVADGLATITLNRPAKFNSMSMSFARELHTAAQSLAARTDVGAVILRANGAAFCAGGDIDGIAAALDRDAYMTELADELHGALALLSSIPIVIVAAVRGAVVGGGVGLMLAADIVIAGDDVSFLPAYDRLGFSPDCGVTAHLPEVIGVRRALQFSLGGKPIGVAEALDWGLVGEVVPVADVEQRARDVAERVLRKAPHALGQTRRLIRSSGERTLQQNLDLEARTIIDLSSGEESQRCFGAMTATRAGAL